MPTGMDRTDAVWTNVYEPLLFPKQKASTRTDQIEWMIQRKLMEIAVNRFEWTVPDTVNIRWMELALDLGGCAVVYEDETGSVVAQRGIGTNSLNRFGDPTEFIVWGAMGESETISADKCVAIWPNYMRVPDWDIITVYAKRLADADRSLEINAKQARRSKIISVSENGQLTAQNINKLIEDGAGVIPIQNDLMIDDLIRPFDLGINPDMLTSLHIFRTREWTEAMTMLGINNSNQDKKERLTAAETGGNDDVIATVRATNLQARQRACKEIEDRFGVEFKVEYVTDMNTAVLKDVSPGSTTDNPGAIESGAGN